MKNQMDLKIQFIEQKNILRDELDDLVDEHDELLEEYGDLNNQLFYIPTFDYNLYDGLMPGFSFSNSTPIKRSFNYKFEPSYSTKQNELLRLINFNEKKYIKWISNEYLELARRKMIYDQIRYLDHTGMEIVRVNYNNGNPKAIKDCCNSFRINSLEEETPNENPFIEASFEIFA